MAALRIAGPPFLRRYLGFCSSPKRLALISVASAVIQSLALLGVPLYVRHVFGEVLPRREVWPLVVAGLVILLLYVVKIVAFFRARVAVLTITKRATTRMREALLDRVYALSRGFFHQADRGHLHNTLVQDTERADVMVNALAAEVLPAVLSSILLTAALVVINWQLLLILVVIIAPVSLLLRATLVPAVRRRIDRFHRDFEGFSRGIYRVLEIMDLTRLQSAERFEVARQRERMEDFRRTSQAVVVADARYRAAQQTVMAAGGVLILIIGGAFVSESALATGDLVAFYVAVVTLRNAVTLIVSRYSQIMEGSAAMGHIAELLRTSDLRPYEGSAPVPAARSISLRGIRFGYGGKDLFRGLDLEIEPGRTIAITGPNGCGKTSLLYLILGLYRPREGEVLVDGRPLAELDLVEYRRRLGVIAQDPVLFAGTILDNLTYGCPGANEETVLRAARRAGAEDFVKRLPEGFETHIGESGVFLSGGERQRIAVARALVRQPEILILDEPTNHLDQAVVGHLLEEVTALPERPAVVLISHDEQVVRKAERVFVLSSGLLEES